jgi:hypothetical protein
MPPTLKVIRDDNSEADWVNSPANTTGGTIIRVEGEHFGTSLDVFDGLVRVIYWVEWGAEKRRHTYEAMNCASERNRAEAKAGEFEQLRCEMAPGVGIITGWEVVVGEQKSVLQADALRDYRYRKPVVTGITPEQGVNEGAFDMSITGRGFGPNVSFLDVKVGNSRCLELTLVSDSFLICRVPPLQAQSSDGPARTLTTRWPSSDGPRRRLATDDGQRVVSVRAASQESDVVAAAQFTYSGCIDGHVWNEGSCRECAPGTFLAPGTKYAFECDLCPINEYQDKIGSTSCVKCADSTEINDVNAGANSAAYCTCKPDHYRIAGKLLTSEVKSCVPCPAGADCDGGDAAPMAQVGFWKTKECAEANLNLGPGEEQSEKCENAFRQCKPAVACPAGAGFLTDAGGDCASGYMGDACGECSPKYYQLPLGGGVCEPCPQLAEMWLALYFVAALFACVLAYLLSKKGPDLSAISIGTTFLQIYSILGNFDIKWPNQVENTFRFAGFFRLEFQLVSPECSADLDYFERWCTLQLVPLMIVILYGIGFCLVYLCKRYVRRRKGSARMSHLYSIGNAMLMMLDFMYITLCTKIFEFFDCVQDGTGKYYLQPAPTVECYTPEYWTKYFPCGMVALFLYAFGIPLGFMYILVRNKTHIQKDQLARIWGNETSVSRAHGLKVDSDYQNELAKRTNYCRKKYSILYERYKPSHYYWSVVLLMRKFAIVASVSLFSTKPMFQAMVVLWILFVSFVVQREATPFKVFTHDLQSYNLFRDTAKKRYLTKKYGYRWLAFWKRRQRLKLKRESQRYLLNHVRSPSVDNLEMREHQATLQYQTAKRQAKNAFLRSGPDKATATNAAVAAFEAPMKSKGGRLNIAVAKKDRRGSVAHDRRGSVAHAMGAVQTHLQLPFCKIRFWLPLRLKTFWRSFKSMVVEPVNDPLKFSANYNRMESMFIMVAFHVVLAGVLFGTNELCADAKVEDEVYANKYGCLTGVGLWVLVAVCLMIVYGALLFGVVQVLLELYKALYSWEKGRRIARLQLQRQHELAHVRRRMQRRETRLRRQQLLLQHQQQRQQTAGAEAMGGLVSVQEGQELAQSELLLTERKLSKQEQLEELEEASLLLSSAMFVRSGLMPLSIFEDSNETLTESSQAIQELVNEVEDEAADSTQRHSIDHNTLTTVGPGSLDLFHSLTPLQVLHGLVKRHRLEVQQQYAQVKALDWLEQWVQHQQEVDVGIRAVLDSIPTAVRRASLHGVPTSSVDDSSGMGKWGGAGEDQSLLKATFSMPHMTGQHGSLREEIGKRIVVRQAEGPYKGGKFTRPQHRKSLDPYNSYLHQHHHGEHHHRHHDQPMTHVLTNPLTRSAAISYTSTSSGGHKHSGPPQKYSARATRPHLLSLLGDACAENSMSSVTSSMHDLEADSHVVVLQWLLRFFQWGCGFAVLIYVVTRMTTDPRSWGAPRTLTRLHEIWLLSNAAGTIFFLCLSICADAMLSVDELKNIVEKKLPKVLKRHRWLQPYMHSAWDTLLGLLCFCLGVAFLADVVSVEKPHANCGKHFSATIPRAEYSKIAPNAPLPEGLMVQIECPAGEQELTIAGSLLLALSLLLWRSASQLCDRALKRRRHQLEHDALQRQLEAEDEVEAAEAELAVSNPLVSSVSTSKLYRVNSGTAARGGDGEGATKPAADAVKPTAAVQAVAVSKDALEGCCLATIADPMFRELFLRAALAFCASGVIGFTVFAAAADGNDHSGLGGERLLDSAPTFRKAPLSLSLAKGSAGAVIAVCAWCWLTMLMLTMELCGCCARKSRNKDQKRERADRILSRLTTVRCMQVALVLLIIVIGLAVAALATEGFCSRHVGRYIADEAEEDAQGDEETAPHDCPHVQMTLAAALAALIVLDLIRSLLRVHQQGGSTKGSKGKPGDKVWKAVNKANKGRAAAALKEEDGAEDEDEGNGSGIPAELHTGALVHFGSSGKVSKGVSATTI